MTRERVVIWEKPKEYKCPDCGHILKRVHPSKLRICSMCMNEFKGKDKDEKIEKPNIRY